MVSLYPADGALLMGGVGFLHHLTSAAEACKAIIRRFEGDIDQGDLYLLNDPYTAALHTSDIYLVSPIHHDGRTGRLDGLLRARLRYRRHESRAALRRDARDIFTEGFSSPGIADRARRVASATMCSDTFLNMVRSPEMVALDIRSMIACNNVARERLRRWSSATGSPHSKAYA